MDVKKARQPWRLNPKVLWLMPIVGLLVAAVAYARYSHGELVLNRADLVVASVRQGEFTVQVNGYGTLRSSRLRVLTSLNSATVKEILLRPGSVVSTDSVIAVLENPEVEQRVQSAKQDLTQAQANLRQLILTQQLELLQEESNFTGLQARLEAAIFRRVAEEKLLVRGLVSQLAFQETQATERQLQSQLEMQEKRLTSMAAIHRQAISIEQERIEQWEGVLAIAQERLNRLEVRAEFDGVLQRVSVEEGQNLTPGQEVAMIGSTTEMVALLQIPQNQAQFIHVGQVATIDNRRDKISGKVNRIDPVVESNTVTVEIALPGKLPASARPQQNVDGHIVVEQLSQALYMERPAGIRAQQAGLLYRLEPESGRAQLRELEFGFSNGNFIEVRSGAGVDEQYIISDLSRLTSPNIRVR